MRGALPHRRHRGAALVARDHLAASGAACRPGGRRRRRRDAWLPGGEQRDAGFARLHRCLARARPDPRLARRDLSRWSTRRRCASLARIERAASRFWGTLTLRRARQRLGRATRRAGPASAVDRAALVRPRPPTRGCYDNLVGGGVPHGQTPGADAGARGLGGSRPATPAQLRARRRRQRAAHCSATFPKACSTSGCTAATSSCRPAVVPQQPGRRGARLHGCCRWPRRWRWRGHRAR
ncbi:MAG: hypothetical protein MZW92_66620 [Comamonadaceae bacterium]|nr:hypothetical protein [Comamonadaceae bacterium]